MTIEEELSIHDHILDLINRFIQKRSKKQLELFFEKYHSADIAETLEQESSDKIHEFFLITPKLNTLEIFQAMSILKQLDLISELPRPYAKKLVSGMESDNAVELLSELEAELCDYIIQHLPKKKAAYLRLRLSYQEDTAGTLMNSEFISIPENLTVQEALDIIRKSTLPETEVSFYIFVVDAKKKLVGITTLRDLIVAVPSAKVKDFRDDYPIKVLLDEDQEEVARLFQKYDLVVLAVVDVENVLVGIITVDDVVDVVVEEATEDLYKLSGTGDVEEEKLLSGNIFIPVISRLPWLLITVLGGVLASYIITRYSEIYSPTLFSLALSLSFVPLLMGLGGNVGNQSATIAVRGIATGIIKETDTFRYIFRELIVGVLIGVVSAIAVYLTTSFFNINPIISMIVALSLFINIIVAAFIGATLPLLFKKCHIDPAIASAPFISTALDICGQLIYFSLTLYILSNFIS